MAKPIPVRRAHELLAYDETSPSRLRWKVTRRGTARAGAPAGTLIRGGYYHVRIDGQVYLAHRIIYAMHYGDPGTMQVDHVDGLYCNCIDNLRLVQPRGNQRNRRANHGGSSRFKGVCWNGASGRWMTRICIDGKQRYLGIFFDEREAAAAYNRAAIELFGEHARLNDLDNPGKTMPVAANTQEAR